MTRPAMHTLLNQAQTFLAVVDFGSYTKAADFLGISKAMASLHVKALEEALAVTLLVRSTRALSLTEAGKAFHDEFRTSCATWKARLKTSCIRAGGFPASCASAPPASMANGSSCH